MSATQTVPDWLKEDLLETWLYEYIRRSELALLVHWNGSSHLDRAQLPPLV